MNERKTASDETSGLECCYCGETADPREHDCDQKQTVTV